MSGEANPMHDHRVREAMYRAIDEDAIKRQIMRNMATPTALFVPKGVNGYDAALDVRIPYDLAKAHALMEEAGFAKGFTLAMECPNDRYMNDEQICTAIAAMLARTSGIKSVVCCGFITQGCVESTARDAGFYDYYPVVVEDAIANYHPHLHEASLTVQRTRYDVVPSGAVTSIWDTKIPQYA